MTESGWTELTIHHIEHGSITVRVQAETPQDAAALLDPYVNPDTVLSGASTTRQAAVHAILQTRHIAAARNLDQARDAYDLTLEAIRRHEGLTEAAAAQAEQGQPPAPVD